MRCKCQTCGKPTWTGDDDLSALVIEAALKSVSESKRCPGWRRGECQMSHNQQAAGIGTIAPRHVSE